MAGEGGVVGAGAELLGGLLGGAEVDVQEVCRHPEPHKAPRHNVLLLGRLLGSLLLLLLLRLQHLGMGVCEGEGEGERRGGELRRGGEGGTEREGEGGRASVEEKERGGGESVQEGRPSKV